MPEEPGEFTLYDLRVQVAVLAVGWCIDRREVLRQLEPGGLSRSTVWLYHWLRFVVPLVILLVAGWWLTSVL